MHETPITKAIDRLIDLQLERHAWLAGAASAIEAATAGETTQIGSTEGESAVPQADAQRRSHDD